MIGETKSGTNDLYSPKRERENIQHASLFQSIKIFFNSL